MLSTSEAKIQTTTAHASVRAEAAVEPLYLYANSNMCCGFQEVFARSKYGQIKKVKGTADAGKKNEDAEDDEDGLSVRPALNDRVMYDFSQRLRIARKPVQLASHIFVLCSSHCVDCLV
jgi:hypothetical protein